MAKRRTGTFEDPAPTGETCNAWHKRFHAYQVELGRSAAGDAAYRWAKWISPRIGPRAMATITRDDIEDIRDALDAAILAWTTEGKGEGRVSGKTGMNIWSALVSAFKAATASGVKPSRRLASAVQSSV